MYIIAGDRLGTGTEAWLVLAFPLGAFEGVVCAYIYRKKIRKENSMEVKDYCRNVEMELTLWKSKLYDVIRKMDEAATGDKEKMYEDINGLHILMTELEDRVDALRTSCPNEWRPEEEEIKVKFGQLQNRYKETAKFDYDFGG